MRVNEYGVPLHACNGYIQDEHRWEWLKQLTMDEIYGKCKERYSYTSSPMVETPTGLEASVLEIGAFRFKERRTGETE
jgi:hypothetical protein